MKLVAAMADYKAQASCCLLAEERSLGESRLASLGVGSATSDSGVRALAFCNGGRLVDWGKGQHVRCSRVPIQFIHVVSWAEL